MSIEIQDALLTVNEYSRPGQKLRGVRAVVMHWTANPQVSAMANRNFFEMRKGGHNGFGSAHYIVGIKGEVVRCIPEDEVAYHCGSSQADPASGKVYTDLARERFGEFARDYKRLSPNLVTIGVEMCPLTDKGHFADETLEAAKELVTMILSKHLLCANDVLTHHDVVGWKDCPRLWVRLPKCFEAFKKDVSHRLAEHILG